MSAAWEKQALVVGDSHMPLIEGKEATLFRSGGRGAEPRTLAARQVVSGRVRGRGTGEGGRRCWRCSSCEHAEGGWECTNERPEVQGDQESPTGYSFVPWARGWVRYMPWMVRKRQALGKERSEDMGILAIGRGWESDRRRQVAPGGRGSGKVPGGYSGARG